ncbi:hypothetical protein HOF92_09920 [bacterium]|jgi:hypothetical protein|nr:hypothetical protein [bacterium]
MNGFRAFLHFSVQFLITLSLLSCILYSAGVRSSHVTQLLEGKIPVYEKPVEEPAEETTSEESEDRSLETENMQDSDMESVKQAETSTAPSTTETASASMSILQTETIEDIPE